MSKIYKCLRLPFPDIGKGIYSDKENGAVEVAPL